MVHFQYQNHLLLKFLYLSIRTITLPEHMTIKELADKMKVQASAIVKKLFLKGQMVTVNQEIDYENAEEIALEFNCIAEPEEKIDIVKWSEDISEFISAALSPAKVVKVELLPGETRSCRVTVPDQQLSLAIGNKGQNARLCARLTGYNIDIRPESGYYGEDEEPKKDAADAE